MSALKRVLWKLLAPIVAALASLAARYAAKKAPEFIENTVVPWMRQATENAGGAAEKVPDLARSAVSSGGDLAERLTDRARDVTGGGSSESSSGSDRSRRLTQKQLSERSDDRAKRRAQRRKATKTKAKGR
jgi:hypothetical protein